ncbi:MAG: RdgB/HAM1 family non-canonical purine NTP pyrophosphatase [Candidatus Hydrogenedentales bacterium]
MGNPLLIGSGNRDKAAELRELLHDTSWDVISLAQMPLVGEPEETAESFKGNALLKARYYGGHYEMPCVADDSGLEVDALGGAPGVFSARYAGPNCTYADNNLKLLEALKDVPDAERTGRFVCCAAFVDRDGSSHVTMGTVEGLIAQEPKGSLGFGYDPLFIPLGQELTFAQMPPEEKHRVSHRGRAFRAMREFLAGRV